jgi:hypothetical protein
VRGSGGRRRQLAGITSKCIFGYGLGSSLAWEQESEARSASRGSGRGNSGRRRRPAVRCGSGRRRAICAHGKVGERGRSGWREPSPQRGAFGAHPRRRGSSERPRRGGSTAEELGRLRVFGRRRRLRLGEELGHEGGALNRAAAALACGPGALRGRRPCRSRVRVRAGLVPEVGDDPDGWAPLVSERRGKRRGRQAARGTGLGEEGARPRGGQRMKLVGWAVQKERKKGRLGVGRKEEKREWAGPN